MRRETPRMSVGGFSSHPPFRSGPHRPAGTSLLLPLSVSALVLALSRKNRWARSQCGEDNEKPILRPRSHWHCPWSARSQGGPATLFAARRYGYVGDAPHAGSTDYPTLQGRKCLTRARAALPCSTTRTGAVPPTPSRDASAASTVNASRTAGLRAGEIPAISSSVSSVSPIPRFSHTRTHAPATS